MAQNPTPTPPQSPPNPNPPVSNATGLGMLAHAQDGVRKGTTGWVYSFLAVCGIYWLSLWLAALLGLSVGITHSATFSESVLSAFYLGAFMSWERTLAAILAGVAVTLIVKGRRPQFWSLLLGALYVVDYRVHGHWVVPPNAWNRLSMRVEHFLPAVACIVAAFIVARFQARSKSATVQQAG